MHTVLKSLADQAVLGMSQLAQHDCMDVPWSYLLSAINGTMSTEGTEAAHELMDKLEKLRSTRAVGAYFTLADCLEDISTRDCELAVDRAYSIVGNGSLIDVAYGNRDYSAIHYLIRNGSKKARCAMPSWSYRECHNMLQCKITDQRKPVVDEGSLRIGVSRVAKVCNVWSEDLGTEDPMAIGLYLWAVTVSNVMKLMRPILPQMDQTCSDFDLDVLSVAMNECVAHGSTYMNDHVLRSRDAQFLARFNAVNHYLEKIAQDKKVSLLLASSCGKLNCKGQCGELKYAMYVTEGGEVEDLLVDIGTTCETVRRTAPILLAVSTADNITYHKKGSAFAAAKLKNEYLVITIAGISAK
ncbi:hypothetical protein HK098_002821 [Nowakowskiella sp. JEL0407]|nr:hypothetical protein HK098_002821 [Nowakowskiella sp. JEL0407]